MTQKTDAALSVANLSRPGAYLRELRESSAVSREYLRSQLGLTEALFSALERDDHRRLPAPVFVRGYLRRYAELLNVRVAPVLAAYQRYLEEQGLAVIPQEEPSERPLRAMVAAALALLMATSLVFGAIATEPVEEAAASATQAETAEPPVAETPKVAAEDRLTMRFATDSWVEVVDARDHILAVNLQREGSVLQLEGLPPFQVTVGYGPGVTISYLGERISFDTDPETFAAKVTIGQ